ncbi:hypothetical protein [Sphingomonas sp.]|uniref:hypothetical protein n=1 Tax=Sphingomonas sp. TaxID=28214 RepID=UPI000DB7E912|nr:hypothetical protein [Sphingomonas sp.]PZU08514.1 MAG: hypothetical protein DI605_11090 [Sphingomonas sp.]
MQIIDNDSLLRGATLVDYAFSDRGKHLTLQVPDYIGIVAAYLDRGRDPDDIETVLGKHLNINIGRRAKQTFDLFEDFRGHGLWMRGASADDIRFVHQRLIELYPDLNAAQRMAFDKY